MKKILKKIPIIPISKVVVELPLLLQEVENEGGKRDLVIVFPNKGHLGKINLSSGGKWTFKADTLQVLIKVNKKRKEK